MFNCRSDNCLAFVVQETDYIPAPPNLKLFDFSEKAESSVLLHLNSHNSTNGSEVLSLNVSVHFARTNHFEVRIFLENLIIVPLICYKLIGKHKVWDKHNLAFYVFWNELYHICIVLNT